MMKKLFVLLIVMLMTTVFAASDGFYGFPFRQGSPSGTSYRVDPGEREWVFSAFGTPGAVAYDTEDRGYTVWNYFTTATTTAEITLIASGSGVTFECASSSAQDSADISGTAGTGAHTVRALFINDAGEFKEETFIMDGTTVEVTVGIDYVACVGAYLVTVGTGVKNAGDIYISADTTWSSGVPVAGATATPVWVKINTGVGVSQGAFGYVPPGLTGHFKNLEFCNNASGGYVEYGLYVQTDFGPVNRVKRWNVNDQLSIENLNTLIPEKSYWEIKAVNSTGSTEVQVTGTMTFN